MSDYFPPEIIVEILLKLPVKSLVRFTAVCKSWRSIITSSSFISCHLYNPSNQTLLLRRYDNHDKQEHYSLLEVSENRPFCIDSSSELKFPFKSQIGYFRVVGSCHGIICLSDDFFANPKQPIVLWNPSIKTHLVLPKAVINPKKPHGFVLGFGVADHDFRVVRLVYYRKSDDFGFNHPPEAEVFSLRTRRWRRLRGIDVRLQIVEFMWCQVFLNGVVHWLGYHQVNDDQIRSSILAFRVGQEVFDEITLPDELAWQNVSNLSLSLIGESLAVIKYDRDLGNESCDVWLMEKYGVEDSWTKLYSFSLVEGMEKVVAFRKDGEVLVASQGLGLVVYEPEIRKTRNLGINGTTRSFYVDNYVESLQLLRGESEIAMGLNEGAEDDLIRDGCRIV